MPIGVRLRAWGPTACFTRPELKAEAVTYEVPTPSASRGLLEAVFWKPQFLWEIRRIHVLTPPRFTTIRRNGVASKIPARTAEAAMKAGRGWLGLLVEDDRQQMSATVLRDVHYVIEAVFHLTSKADPAKGDSEGKYLDMFRRRAEAGQCFHRPYLGCREHECHFAFVDSNLPIPGPADPLPDDWRTGWPAIDDADRSGLLGERDLGYMLHDIDFAAGRTARFFHAVMTDGVVTVPPRAALGYADNL
jgi:CRISPR-associated protein Cas5, subtype I-C/DVULG